MSYQAVKAVLENSKHSGTTKLVLVCIAEHHNEKTKTSWPGIDTLSGYCNVSRQSIFNSLNKLTKSGELKIDYKAGPHGVNVYHILCLDNAARSSQLDRQASLTVKPALLRQSSQLDGTVKPALPEPLGTIKKPLKRGGAKKPAVVHVYNSIVNSPPHKSLWAKMDNLVGDSEKSLLLFRRIVESWIAVGWKPNNIKGMLEYFERGEIPGEDKKNGHSRRKSKTSGNTKSAGGDIPEYKPGGFNGGAVSNQSVPAYKPGGFGGGAVGTGLLDET